jgi:hypothetical protein
LYGTGVRVLQRGHQPVDVLGRVGDEVSLCVCFDGECVAFLVAIPSDIGNTLVWQAATS